METEILVSVIQNNCKHETYREYAQRGFDVLNGFEVIADKCCNCHKTLKLTIRKLTSFDS